MTVDANLNYFVFMKVGRHAGESFEEIIERKRREYARTGMIWWGYGGNTLHPIRAVQPFARYTIENGLQLKLVMEEVISSHPDTEVFAREYSRDGVNWESVPDGIAVRGSRFALVLDEIQAGDLTEIDLTEYRVANGPSRGKSASEYLRYRVDKGCFMRAGRPNEAVEPKIVRTQYVARLRDPFAVLLRS